VSEFRESDLAVVADGAYSFNDEAMSQLLEAAENMVSTKGLTQDDAEDILGAVRLAVLDSIMTAKRPPDFAAFVMSVAKDQRQFFSGPRYKEVLSSDATPLGEEAGSENEDALFARAARVPEEEQTPEEEEMDERVAAYLEVRRRLADQPPGVHGLSLWPMKFEDALRVCVRSSKHTLVEIDQVLKRRYAKFGKHDRRLKHHRKVQRMLTQITTATDGG